MSGLTTDFVTRLRTQFPALARRIGGRPAVFLDGPAGTQCPQRVIDAVSRALGWTNANHGGLFATSQESDAMLDEAHRAVADFLGATDPDCISFGANMTSLTFAFSRALAREWQPGDEVIVTRLDHDANVTSWVLAARDAGATIRIADMRLADGTLDTDHLRRLISPRTRLVAIGAASNSTGSINPIGEITSWAHEAGALVFVDAVHYAPHQLPDVTAWNCDFLACSAYKFFGPHVGILCGKRPLLESLAAYKVRPAPDSLPGKWMTGTQNHEGIAGVLAAIDYLADLGRSVTGDASLARRPALVAAYDAIIAYERKLALRLLAGLAELPAWKVCGVTDPARIAERMPTLSITHRSLPSAEVAKRLGELGIFAWHGNYYALGVTESLGLEPQGMTRLGIVHYNTEEEIARTLDALRSIPNEEANHDLPMNPYPTKLARSAPDRLQIEWSDGQTREYTARALRDICPCATCREKRNAPQAPPSLLTILKPEEARPLTIAGMKPVGNYAYSIEFSDGHDTGIFTLTFLHELGEVKS